MRNQRFSDVIREPHTGLFFRKGGNTVAPKGRLILLHGVGSNEANLALLADALPEALEVLKVLKPAELESLYLLFENTAQARVTALLL